MIYQLETNNINLQKDEITFNILTKILSNNHEVALTNGRSIIIGRTNKDFCACIWTSDDITDEEYNELAFYMPILFENDNKPGIMAKPQIADKLSALIKGQIATITELISYKCEKVMPPKPVGTVKHPQSDETRKIAEFLNGFKRDCFGTIEDVELSMERANYLVADENFYILEMDGITVAMAYMGAQDEKFVRIHSVYTAPEYRNKGYAAYLVSEICKKSHKIDKLPILYADAANPSSNKVYKKIGFTECGRIKEIKMVR